MRAVVHDRYGPSEVLRLEKVERPVPRDDQVLVRVHATTVTRSDCGWRAAHPALIRVISGLRRPRRRILGTEMAGEVAAVGSAVTEFTVGDRVFGTPIFGAWAEYVAMRARGPVAHMPAGMSFEDAAAVCDGAILALNTLRPAELGPGRRILVYGASGSIGTAGVQLARHSGAHVTAVCGTRNLELVRSLGADEVIDYTQVDFTRTGERYDVILDAVGKLTFGRCRGSLVRGGVYLPTDGASNLLVWAPLTLFGPLRPDGKRVPFSPPRYTKEKVLFLKGLIEGGEYRAVIDRTYPLGEVVEANRHVETQRKTGNVVLAVA